MNSQTIKLRRGDSRTIAEVRHHYLVERELSDRLRKAPKDERRHLYTSLYNEICTRVPNIPLWNSPAPPEVRRQMIEDKVKFLRHFVDSDSTFLEIGPGNCDLAIAIAAHVKRVYAVDVSTEITSNADLPANFELKISDGCSVDVPEESVDVAYSNQLMEHLHPDDALEQLGNVHRALKPGGVYICLTPSKLSGPHDVSKYFDDVPTGFHLREYSTTELARIFRAAGFHKVQPFLWLKSRLCIYPLLPVEAFEIGANWLPAHVRRPLCNRFPVNRILGRVIAYKAIRGT